MKCAILVNRPNYERVFDEQTLAELTSVVDVVWKPYDAMTPERTMDLISGADMAITCWGSVKMRKEILDCAPDLRLIAHAAGSVKPVVSEEVAARGIKVTTAAPALGVGVAEFCLGAMIMMGKRLKEQMQSVESGGWRSDRSADALELFRAKVGIVGAGFVGRHLIKLLKPFELESVCVYDPYLSDDQAAELGVQKLGLGELISTSDYISINAPSTDETKSMISRSLIEKIKPNAVFINTARGALVDEVALTEALKQGRFCAVIDVTDPEPPVADSPLRSLPNVILTPHIAGSISRNLKRNGIYAAREVMNFVHGKPLVYPVELSNLDRIA